MRSSNLFDYQRVLRFIVIGLLNTALGYAVILAGLWLGYGDIPSNAMGYLVGLSLGFFLNRKWTFARIHSFRSGTVQRYATTFLFAYGANLAIVITARSAGITENPVVHLVGICVYSIIFYLGSVLFVFVKDQGPSSADQ